MMTQAQPQQLTPGQIIRFHQKEPPVDVKAIASDLGINVWEMRDLPKGISGKIFLDPLNGGSSGYSIGVKATEPFFRKRFTVAHEIAHFILHRSRIGEALSDDEMYRSGLPSSEEAAANQLAAQILMPADLIVKLKSRGCDTPAQLARALQVSEPAMKVRLSYL